VLAIVDWWLAAEGKKNDLLLLEMLKLLGRLRSATSVVTNLQGAALLVLSVSVAIPRIFCALLNVQFSTSMA